MKKVLLAVADAALLIAQIGGAMADQPQDIQKPGVIRVAVPQDFPPFGLAGMDLQP